MTDSVIKDVLRIGLLQLSPEWEDAAGTRAHISSLLADAEPCDLLILPEMGLTGFSMHADRTALTPADHAFFAGLARDRHMAVGYSGNVNGFVAFILLDDTGTVIGRYLKRHLFSPTGESEVYRAGVEAPSLWRLHGWSLLPSVCYDLRFPYQFWQAGREADAILLPASWPTTRLPHWRALLTARAIESQCWTVGVNRTEKGDRPPHYSGGSLVVSPGGEIIADAGDAEGQLTVTLDRQTVAEQRRRFPFSADRQE